VTRTDLEKNQASISMLWTLSEPIELLWDRLREVQRIAAYGNEPISDAAIVELAHLLFESSGVFPHACETWLARGTAANQRSYADFITTFNNANKERLRHQTTSQAGYHSANAATPTPARHTPAPSTPSPSVASGTFTANDGTQLYYCWTHGLGFNKNHTSATCSNPAEGHCQTATVKNMHGGNNTIMSNRRKPKTATATAATVTSTATTTATGGTNAA